MQLQFFNAPKKSLCFATDTELMADVWARVEAMEAPWLVVLGRDGRATGAMPTEVLRTLMELGPPGTVAELPFKGATVLPRASRLSEVLQALKSPEIDAVVLVDGELVHTVVTRQPSGSGEQPPFHL